MQLDQIIIRPTRNELLLQYSDEFKRPINVTLDATGNAAVAAIVADARQRTPLPQDRPDKAQIQKQIVQLEGRVRTLKQSIGEV